METPFYYPLAYARGKENIACLRARQRKYRLLTRAALNLI